MPICNHSSLPSEVLAHLDIKNLSWLQLGFSLASAWRQLDFSLASEIIQLGYPSTNLNRTGLRLMDLCYDGWTDRVPQKAPTSTNRELLHFLARFHMHKQFCK
jgi:hypothetical protein